jgi:S1-C subfamily serine protease
LIPAARRPYAEAPGCRAGQGGRIGVSIQDLTPDLAESLHVDQTDGAVIAGVESGSPAAEAGLKSGDVVIAVDKHPVRNASGLRNYVGLLRVGTTVELTVLRGGRRMDVSAKVAPAPAPARKGQPG